MRVNREGKVVTGNGVISQKLLEPNTKVPPRTCDADARYLFGCKLTWSQAMALFTFAMSARNIPTEKHRDHDKREQIMLSAASYAISAEQTEYVKPLPEKDKNTYLVGCAHNTLQKLR